MSFLSSLQANLQAAIQWMPRGAIGFNKVQPSDTLGRVLTTTADGSVWKPGAIPIGGVIDYFGTTEPDGWLFCTGQAIPSTYTEGIATIGANTPDLRGRVTAGLDNMGGTDAGRLSWANTMGTAGGSQSIAAKAAIGASNGNPNTVAYVASTVDGLYTTVSSYTVFGTSSATTTFGFNHHTPVYDATNGSTNLQVMQPTMVCNKLIRVA